MGEENCLPTVEESTEPPIRAQLRGTEHGPSTTAGQQPHPDEIGPQGSLPVAHILTPEQVARALGVDINHGLSTAEAASRLQRYGPNKVKGAAGVSAGTILLRQVTNSLTLILTITMGLSYGIHDFIEGGVITAVILLNIVVGFSQDYKAEKTLQSLKNLTAPESNVLRNGKLDKIKAADLVPGDIVSLTVGDIVPADLRLIDAMNAYTDEKSFTGESLPVEKHPEITFDDEYLPFLDRTNMAFSTTEMKSGRCTGIVTATGMQTEVGNIAKMLRGKPDTPEDTSFVKKAMAKTLRTIKSILGLVGTPLQVTLSKFALLLFALAILLAVIVFSTAKWDVDGEILIYGICVAVAVIPESLIAVLTITVALGAKEMAKHNVITRVSSAIEAVGGVTNICSDKTGTLTQGRMIAHRAVVPGVGTLTVHDTTDPFSPESGRVELDGKQINPRILSIQGQLAIFLRTIALCNLSTVESTVQLPTANSSINKEDEAAERRNSVNSDTVSQTSGSITRSSPETPRGNPAPWKATGEPTEIALHVLAKRFDMGREEVLRNLDIHHAAEFPFDSTVKKMTVVYRSGSAHLDVYTKGATEFVVPVLNISENEKAKIVQDADKMASDGLRVLCIAHKTLPLGTDLSERQDIEKDLNFVGLVAIYDPPRLETRGAVRDCKLAGITVHMLTGDHHGTALAIARDVGILDETVTSENAGSAVMLAKDFDQLNDDEVDMIEELPLVIARCSPATKVKMVSALHRRKKFCVMTGDGVNDSPALKQADVGMAMGTGSDVAKDASKMVLTDDNFASIVRAIKEGRRLYDNIQKFLMHLLISNIAQVLLLLIGLSFQDSAGHSIFPLSPIEILWVNLITSSFLAIGLGLEESQADSMFRPPHDLAVGIFTKELIVDKFIYGFFMGSLCLASFAIVAYAGPGGGNLGDNCNDWNETCDLVFRARGTTYATITLLLLVTAWEVKHFARSLFNMYPGYSGPPGLSVFATVYRNKFLFWAVAAGFGLMFPIIYIPVINRSVFRHVPITWEWGVSFGCVVVYVAAIESWKAVKRRFGIWSGGNKVFSLQDAEARAGLKVSAAGERGKSVDGAEAGSSAVMTGAPDASEKV